ncbi:MAG: DUF1957 domain-containing protein [Proteobacteria bacterium]|nr:DUF1957 domain-containing protein [Pseudomonadota bacterium]
MQTESVPGLKLISYNAPFFEIYFDWSELPEIDVSQEYYQIEIVPDSPYLPSEYIRPNSDGPLYCKLNNGVSYTINLHKVLQLNYEVESSLSPHPYVDLIQEHENFNSLIWGNIDWHLLKKRNPFEWLEIRIGESTYRHHIESPPEIHFQGHPAHIQLFTEKGDKIFAVKTNLDQRTLVRDIQITVQPKEISLGLSRCVKADSLWRVKAEISPEFDVEGYWKRWATLAFPDTSAHNLIAEFQFFEDNKPSQRFRQLGYVCHLNKKTALKIQSEEWQLQQPYQIEQYRIELQITSAHRELFKYPLFEKTLTDEKTDQFVSLSENDLVKAKEKLFQINRHVSWDQSHLELVLWFHTQERGWYEYQRETAHLMQRDFIPQETTKKISVQLVFYEIRAQQEQKIYKTSGIVERDLFDPKVVLKPFNTNKLLVLWQFNKQGVEEFVNKTFAVSLDKVDFFIKVHEEYLGKRSGRPDLDCQIFDLFASHQNCYLDVEPDRTYSAEIVVRYQDREFALAAVSQPIVAPKNLDNFPVISAHKKLDSHWYHPSQREVEHEKGIDSRNKAKVLIHLHMHSPSLIRLDPFREGFLRDTLWPIETDDGYQVHNPPGEWVLRNCLDSWLPLLRTFRSLVNEGVDYQISLDITPPVAYTLCSSRFKDYFSRYLLRVMSKTKSQIALMKSKLDSPDFIWAAEEYLKHVQGINDFYHFDLNKNIIGAYRDLELKGYLELSTCTATHGMPANQETLPTALRAQIALAARSHHRIFGDRPKGIWLAENSTFPGIEKYLVEEDLHYFFVEAEAITCSSNSPEEEEFNPVILPKSDIVAFGRSRLGRVQVWDADIGYAGHQDFKEYHHRHYGLPIKKITSKTSDIKEAYHPEKANSTAKEQAQEFYNKLFEKADEISQKSSKSIPLITCSYDAELFGHHWWEGPVFLEELMREFHRRGDKIGLTAPSHYLANRPVLPETMPNPSTWGHNASHLKWNDPKVAWVQRELEQTETLLQEYLKLARSDKFSTVQAEMVVQMGAELLRAQSSDLTFVIMAGDFEEDMEREIQKFLNYFYRFKYLIDNNIEDLGFLKFRQIENDMFPEISAYYEIAQKA